MEEHNNTWVSHIVWTMFGTYSLAWALHAKGIFLSTAFFLSLLYLRWISLRNLRVWMLDFKQFRMEHLNIEKCFCSTLYSTKTNYTFELLLLNALCAVKWILKRSIYTSSEKKNETQANLYVYLIISRNSRSDQHIHSANYTENLN